MALNIYQTPVVVLGGITQDPYHLNLFQFPVLVLGTNYTPPVAFSYVASGNISIGSESLCKLKLQYISINNNLILSGNSNINVDYFGPYTIIKVRFVSS